MCFVSKFLPQYDPDSLWRDLRNPLIHAYSVKDGKVYKGRYKSQTYVFRDDGKGHMDNVPIMKDRKEIKRAKGIEISHFVKDVCEVFVDFKKLVEKDDRLKKIVIKRFDKEPVIGPVK